MSIWLEGPKINSIIYRSFIVKGRNSVVAAIVYADDGYFYLTFSKSVAGVIKDLILPSPFINQDKKRTLIFTIGSKKITSYGYLITTESSYDLDLLTEEIRFIIEACLGIGIKVRRYKSPDFPLRRELSDEEKKLFELAPIDIPSDIVSEKDMSKSTDDEGEKDASEQ
ncbi:MAG: hypothetical protein QXK24_00780 [Ignisphaera sp.]|uniref:Uncharacterized protein n=1 Tax=Ignisphaera aggregans TaxID=334771 RepID=A0A7C4H5B5_9CREN